MREHTAAPGESTLVPGSIASHQSCLLVKLGQVSFRLQEAALAALDLRVRHFSVLQALADRGPSVQLELGRYLRIDPATMAT
jgi:DNA-binding MarR family transcriptional regulator